MLKSRRLIFAGTAVLTVSALTLATPRIRLDAREPAHLLTGAALKAAFREKHGETEGAFYDLSELPALGEDGNCQGSVGGFQCFGIFDGHSGWSTSNYVAANILPSLRRAYEKRVNTGGFFGLWRKQESNLSNDDFDAIISEGFQSLDDDILQAPLRALNTGDVELAASTLPVAMNGSCAMLAMYHPVRHIIKVALLGDSRAVLGTQDTNGVWHARNLTTDLTGANPSEIERIRREHPMDPPNIVANGRVLGYEPSRVFGDGSTKWTREQQDALRAKFYMRRTNPLLKSPPYLIAKPVITTAKIDPSRPSFVVLGCDGLYEWLSNEQVVSLVAQWLDKNPVIPHKQRSGIKDDSDDNSGKAFNYPRALGWGPLKPTVEDDNAATHLIRNALGGADVKKVEMLVSIPAPMSRRHRDDITCTVVFFDPSSSLLKSRL